MMADMRQLCLMLGIASVLSIGVFGFEKRCYRNSSDPDGVFTLVLRQTFSNTTAPLARQILALDAISAPTNCKSYVVVGSSGAPDVNELIIKYKIPATSMQLSPTEDCQVVLLDPTSFKVYVVVQQELLFVQATDLFYSATCNTSAIDPGFVELGPLNITNNATFEQAPNRNSSVIMELVTEAGDVTTTPVLGQLVKIRTTYFFASDASASEFPRGLHNFNLTVGPDSGADVFLRRHPFSEFSDSHKRILTTNPKSGPGKNVFETGTFRVVMFATTRQLHFTGRYSAECYEETESKCFNQTDYCATLPNGRKRRAVDRDENGSSSMSITIGLPGQYTTAQNVGPVNDIKAQECVADKTYWILAVVLGVVLLIVTMVTMYIFCRLRSEQQRVDRIDEKSGFKNPAF